MLRDTTQVLRCLIGWHDYLYMPPKHPHGKKKLLKGSFVCRWCGHE